MVGHCYYRAIMALGVDNVYVATCDIEIYDYIISIGGNVVMTSDSHDRATTRAAEALNKIEAETDKTIDIVIMVQGDEPLVQPDIIKRITPCFRDKMVRIVNVMSRFLTKKAFNDENNVKVVVNNNNDALYFSREPIPSQWQGWSKGLSYMQTGIIAFRRESLIEFNSMKETRLEKIESVDMNRVLETGGEVRMLLTEAKMIGVDTPDELSEVESIMKNDALTRKYLKY